MRFHTYALVHHRSTGGQTDGQSFINSRANATKNQAPKADPTKANRGVFEGASGAAAAAPVVYKCMGRKPGAK